MRNTCLWFGIESDRNFAFLFSPFAIKIMSHKVLLRTAKVFRVRVAIECRSTQWATTKGFYDAIWVCRIYTQKENFHWLDRIQIHYRSSGCTIEINWNLRMLIRFISSQIASLSASAQEWSAASIGFRFNMLRQWMKIYAKLLKIWAANWNEYFPIFHAIFHETRIIYAFEWERWGAHDVEHVWCE